MILDRLAPRKLAFFLLVLSLTSFNSHAGWDDIDWATCGPSGVTRRIQLMSNPKSFWARQHTDLEMILKTNLLTYEGDRNDCIYGSQNNEAKIATCLVRIDTRIKNIQRCLAHSAQMCQINGGYC